jgi:hypothetical protein
MVSERICCRFWRRVGELFTTISMIDGIREEGLALHHYCSEDSGQGALVEKVVCCEGSSVGMFTDLVNGSVQ